MKPNKSGKMWGTKEPCSTSETDSVFLEDQRMAVNLRPSSGLERAYFTVMVILSETTGGS